MSFLKSFKESTSVERQAVTFPQNNIDHLLSQLPKSWMGTTFPNDKRYLGRDEFIDSIVKVLKTEKAPVNLKEFLGGIYPDDYVRVGSPLSVVYEIVKSYQVGVSTPYCTFSFASKTMPVISVLFTASNVDGHVYVVGKRLFDQTQERLLKNITGTKFTQTSYLTDREDSDIVVYVVEDSSEDELHKALSVQPDCIASLADKVLFVMNEDKVPAYDVKNDKGSVIRESIHTIRKRFVGPVTNDEALNRLSNDEQIKRPSDDNLNSIHTHLSEMAGFGTDFAAIPLVATVGLSASGALVMSAVDLGNNRLDMVLCSTCYGGSSQQCDIFGQRNLAFNKYTFDIQGKDGNVYMGLATKLQEIMSDIKRKSSPVTMVHIEYPTNPDMKDCRFDDIEELLLEFEKKQNTQIFIMFDTTFSPPSKVGQFFKSNKIPVIVFNSLSKSVAGGLTTGGSLAANNNDFAQKLLTKAHVFQKLLDLEMKDDQYKILASMHQGCEDRVLQAHQNCKIAANVIEQAVLKYSNILMKVNFVTQKQMENNVTPATFSFNLPLVPEKLGEITGEKLAQAFVDNLVSTNPQGVKPCVSFGQSNSYVYATVPATSTQGAIKAEDKGKQTVDGVQLVRLSFPPTMDVDKICKSIDSVIYDLYSKSVAAA